MGKMVRMAFFLAAAVVFFGVASASADSVSFYTGDNSIIGAWLITDGEKIEKLNISGVTNNWREPKQFVDFPTLDPTRSYQIIWEVTNDDNDAGYRLPNDPGNPGGFLADLNLPELPGDNVLSSTSSAWGIYVNWVNTEAPDFSKIAWNTVTEYGTNGSNKWWKPIANINSNAQWIWWERNAVEGAPGIHAGYQGKSPGENQDGIFIRYQYTPVPIPGAVWLLGSGLLGLLGFRRKFVG